MIFRFRKIKFIRFYKITLNSTITTNFSLQLLQYINFPISFSINYIKFKRNKLQFKKITS